MDDTEDAAAARVLARLDAGDPATARSRLETVQEAPVEARKATLRALRTAAEDDPATVGELCAAVVSFLADDDRAVRLSAAKLFVAVASGDAPSVVPTVEALADRLADEAEFSYVRARCAEALGYVALDRPTAVNSPEVLADLRVGLAFDEPEVREKLAKALECVALGDPGRLRHQVGSLADHLDDDREIVRYHLCTALAAVGCAHPAALAEAREALAARLTDGTESPYVRGRAAEALASLGGDLKVSRPTQAAAGSDDAEAFLTRRLALLQEATDGTDDADVGTLSSLREGTEAVVEAMTAPEGDGCPHCGFALPESRPPMCPRCGGPT